MQQQQQQQWQARLRCQKSPLWASLPPPTSPPLRQHDVASVCVCARVTPPSSIHSVWRRRSTGSALCENARGPSTDRKRPELKEASEISSFFSFLSRASSFKLRLNPKSKGDGSDFPRETFVPGIKASLPSWPELRPERFSRGTERTLTSVGFASYQVLKLDERHRPFMGHKVGDFPNASFLFLTSCSLLLFQKLNSTQSIGEAYGA